MMCTVYRSGSSFVGPPTGVDSAAREERDAELSGRVSRSPRGIPRKPHDWGEANVIYQPRAGARGDTRPVFVAGGTPVSGVVSCL